jgi:hypothetical protein
VPEQPVQEVTDNNSQGAHVISAISRDEEAGGVILDSISNAAEPAPDVYVQIVSGTSLAHAVHGGKIGDVELERNHDAANAENNTHGPRQGTRVKRPNVRTQGPEWM